MIAHARIVRAVPSAVAGLLIVVMASWLAGFGLRYLVFGAIGMVVATVIAAAPDRRRLFLAAFILSLQLDATMYFFYRGGVRGSGWSGPVGIELPLSFIPAALMVGMAAVAAMAIKRSRWDWGGCIGYAGMLVVASVALSLLPSNERFLTFCSAIRAGQLFLILLAMANLVRGRDDVQFIAGLLSALLVTQSLVYLVETATGATFALSGDVIEQGGTVARHGGTVGITPSAFASFLHPLVQIALAQFIAGGRRAPRWQAMTAGLGVLAMLLTYSRAPWGGLALGAAVVVVLGFRRGLINMGRIAVCGAIGGAALLVTLPTMSIRFANNAADANERFALMRMALRVIEAHPLLGVGAGAYGFNFGNYLTAELEGNWLYIVHNAYLLRWAETGLLGIVAFLTFLLIALRDAVRLSRSTDRAIAVFGVGWTAGLVAVLWEMWWDIWNGFPYNALLWALCGFAVAVHRIDRSVWPAGMTGAAVRS